VSSRRYAQRFTQAWRKNICRQKENQNLIDADSALNHVSESSEQVTGFLLPRKPSSNFG
jgi:hypothetical protein